MLAVVQSQIRKKRLVSDNSPAIVKTYLKFVYCEFSTSFSKVRIATAVGPFA